MLGSEDKESKLSGSPSLPLSPWSFLCCKSGISSAEKEPARDENSESANKKKPGGWKAMPFILGLNILSHSNSTFIISYHA